MTLSLDRIPYFVKFDDKHSHAGDGLDSKFAQLLVINNVEGFHVGEAVMLFSIGGKPSGVVGVGGGDGSKVTETTGSGR